MFIFGKVLDQLIHATSLKINPIIGSLGNLPGLGNFFQFTYCHFVSLLFCKKKDVLQRKYSDLYVDVCRGVCRTVCRTSTLELLCESHKKALL